MYVRISDIKTELDLDLVAKAFDKQAKDDAWRSGANRKTVITSNKIKKAIEKNNSNLKEFLVMNYSFSKGFFSRKIQFSFVCSNKRTDNSAFKKQVKVKTLHTQHKNYLNREVEKARKLLSKKEEELLTFMAREKA